MHSYGLFTTDPPPCKYKDELISLIDNIPSMTSMSAQDAYQKTLASLLLHNIPNDAIKTLETKWKYYGDYNGYRSAFSADLKKTGAAKEAENRVKSLVDEANLPSGAVVELTEEIRTSVSVNIDTGKLAADLSDCRSKARKYCAHLYISSFALEYTPTADAIAAIPEKERKFAAEELHDHIGNGVFTANINQAISAGGDSARNATWFLFNLWTCLDVLGLSDVDGAIKGYRGNGLSVPEQVGPSRWNKGYYDEWYVEGPGSHMFSSTIDKTMKVRRYVQGNYSGYWKIDKYTLGYARSFCEWGSLAYYSNSSASCFSAGTGVLMADGTSKAIEKIRKNDVIQTTLGPRKVLIVESPHLGSRSLWRINNIDVLTTAGHCFRSANKSGPKRLAVNEWITMDSAPTMTMTGGVGKCKEGSVLLGRKVDDGGSSKTEEVVVKTLRAHGDQGNQEDDCIDDRVYDIILEKWWKDEPAYFVGGPKTFLAVDGETCNPITDPPTSAAVLVAMGVALRASHISSASCLKVLPEIIAALDLRAVERPTSRVTSKILSGIKFKGLRIPDIALFEQDDGSWSELASFMEYILISKYGKWLRSVIHTDLSSFNTDDQLDPLLVIGIHDLDMAGDTGLPDKGSVTMEITLEGKAERESKVLNCADAVQEHPYFMAVNKPVEFDYDDRFARCVLRGTMRCEGALFAKFSFTFVADASKGHVVDAVLFAPNGSPVGRIGVSVRKTGRIPEEQRVKTQQTEQEKMARGLALGQQIGFAIANEFTAETSMENFKWLLKE